MSAHLMVQETSRNVCDGFAAALRAHGLPGQVLTDNGKVFTGRFNTPPVEVRVDRVCRENRIEHPDVLQGWIDGCRREQAAQAAASLGNYL